MTSERRRHGTHGARHNGPRRGLIVAVIVAALLVGGVVDRVGAPAASPPAPVVEPVPVAAPASALSSSWFCAGATDAGKSVAPGSVVIANSGPAPVSGVVTLVPSQGSNRTVPVQVGAHSFATVGEAVRGGAAWIGAIVDVDAGAVAVDQVINSPLGVSARPCATSGSSYWYFPTGMTLINADEVISLLNPYPTDSIVDMSFSTTQGLETPQDFQGLDVPADGLLDVDLGSHLRRRQAIATTVHARTGSVVAWETQWVQPPASGAVLLGTRAASSPLADPASPVPGVVVTPGAPSTGTRWVWPDGIAGGREDERYIIYNPNQQTAEVRLSLSLEQGAAEPFDLSIGADQVLPVVAEQQARIPAGVPHSAVVQSLNGVPVVAVRAVSFASVPEGISYLSGGRLASPQWLVPIATSNKHVAGYLVVYNPGVDSVQATVSELANGQQSALPGAGSLTLAPGQRVSVPLSSKPGILAPLVVAASAPVYVESDFYGRGSTAAVSLSLGVPLTT